MVLADSSVWIDLLRGTRTAQTVAIRDLIAVNAAALTLAIYQEVLQGAGSSAHFKELREYFSRLPLLVAADPVRSHEAAAELYARCRWAGVTPRNSFDCLVAITAIEHDVELLADGRDFDAIARIEPRLRIYKAAA